MKIACLTFTKNGEKIAHRLKSPDHFLDIDIYVNGKNGEKIKNSFETIFHQYDGIVFISSTGIAVRFIAPLIQDKTIDPAIVVIDDLGQYAISLLSGHIGGANQLATQLADILAAQAIVTTASDSRGIEAIDLFAKRHGLTIESMEDAKRITAMMIEDKEIQIYSEGPKDIKYPYLVQENPKGIVIISSSSKEWIDNHMTIQKNIPMCMLRPKVFNVGIGCRRGKTKEEILQAIHQTFDNQGLAINAICAIGTIDVKKDEQGIIDVCEELDVEMRIFTTDEIQKVQHQFKSSNFVQSAVGVTSVSEPCAHLLGGKMIVNKTAVNGVTIAVTKEEYHG